MPYENFHNARITSSSKYDEFRQVSDEFGTGINVVYGIWEEDGERTSEVHSIRFDKDKFTVSEAKEWLGEHDYEPIEFEPAKETEKRFTKYVEFEKVDEEERIVGGVVYEPDKVDHQGDWADKETIRKAMFDFMEYSQTIGVMHKEARPDVTVLECFQPEEDTEKAGRMIRKGSWWLACRIHNDDIWKKIKDGELTGFSMGGSATGEENAPPTN